MSKCIKLLTVLCILGSICPSINSIAAENRAGNNRQPAVSVDRIPTSLRASWELLKAINEHKSTLTPANDISPDIADREKDRTLYWINRLVHGYHNHLEGITLVRSINGKDDGAYVAFEYDGYHIGVIDGRDLRIMAYKPGLSKLTTEYIASDLLYNHPNLDLIRCYKPLAKEFMPVLDGIDVGRTLFSARDVEWDEMHKDTPCLAKYDMYQDLRERKISLFHEIVIRPGTSYGDILDERSYWQRWLVHPVQWYRNGDRILLIAQKQLCPPASKVPVPSWQIVGGIPYDDPRPMRRFDNPNVDGLFEEYAAKLPKLPTRTSNKVVGGIDFVKDADLNMPLVPPQGRP